MPKKTLIAGLVALLLLAVPTGPAAAKGRKQLTVSAAISLQNAFTDIGRAFEAADRNVQVVFNFGASGDLMAQIRGGAPVDVFASAAEKDMNVIDGDRLIIRNSRVDFVRNAVVLIKPAPSRIALASFADLEKPAVKTVALGNPASVPAGQYAAEVLRSLKLTDALRDKLVFAGNVRQVLDYVARNEVDAGVVYATDARTRPRDVVVVATAPQGSHRPIRYPIAIVQGTQNEATARRFISFVRSPEGRKILEAYGFQAIR